MGVSGRAILRVLAQGEEDPHRLVALVHPLLQHKHEVLVQAVRGQMRAHHRLLLGELLTLIEAHDRSIAHIEQEISERLRPFESQLAR